MVGLGLSRGARWRPWRTWRHRCGCAPGNVDRVQTDGALGGAKLRPGLTGRKACSGWNPGIASRAVGTGLTGRNWWNWPYRPDSQGRSSELVLPAVIAGSAFCVGLARGDGSTFCRLSTSRLCRFPPAIRGSSDHRLIRFLKNAFFAERIHCISCQVSID
jgi:hypothetical protein